MSIDGRKPTLLRASCRFNRARSFRLGRLAQPRAHSLTARARVRQAQPSLEARSNKPASTQVLAAVVVRLYGRAAAGRASALPPCLFVGLPTSPCAHPPLAVGGSSPPQGRHQPMRGTQSPFPPVCNRALMLRAMNSMRVLPSSIRCSA
ncbi:hypothetical protein CCACVL1_02928 [Corchorus capsularis]|uniref:Uncharacterized protein n=1 Tax=Corchorus capsularis TaxID=210143 RepID=A0A1R3K4R2_COCAP|nr:hypothetical protein CCACVL1_02928 [Corchorus capsularis]